VVKCTNCDFVDEKLLKPRVRDGVILSQMSPCREYEIAYKLDASADAIYTTSFRTECKPGYQEVLIDLVLDTEQNIIVRDLKYTLDGKVSDTKTKAMLDGASLTFKDTKTGKILETVKTNKEGEFISNVLKDAFPGKKIKYEVTISKEKYITQTFEWNINLDTLLDKHLSYQIEMIDIGLDLARIFNLKPIYFDLNKWNIRADAKIELNKIVKALNDNPTVEIELGSHTDCRSSKSYNIKLSDKRAKASAAYIKSRITNPSRIYGKGYGESMLVNGCECEGTIKSTCTEAEHQANRRTEFKIVKY
jgi:outer membrane protein OmpA-like peptidoglycan-associated protein